MSPDERKRFFGLLVLALLIRVAAAFYLGGDVSGLSGAHDEISYSELGHRFATGHGLTFGENWYPWIQADAPQSYYSASMSLLLAGIYMLFGYQPLIARLIFALMSTAVVGMIYLLTRRLFDSQVALLAGLIASAYAYLVFYGVTLVTETPFTLALLLAIYLAYDLRRESRPWHWAALGLALAVALLFRMAVVFFVPILLAWILWERRRMAWQIAIPIVVIVLAIAPFTLENYRKWERFLLLEAQFGHVFWNGNHPGHDWDFHPFETFEIPAEVLALRNDAAITSALLERGLQNVAAEPAHFAMLTLTRMRELFTFWPTGDSTPVSNAMRLLSFGLLVPFTLYGLWSIRYQWQLLLPIYAYLMIHTGVYSVTWTMIRYRIPMDAFFIMVAAAGILPLLRRLGWDAVPVSEVATT